MEAAARQNLWPDKSIKMNWCEVDVQASSANFELPMWKLYLEDSSETGAVDWGDGSPLTYFSGTESGNEFKYSHTYVNSGVYTLKFYGNKIRFGSGWNTASSTKAKMQNWLEIRLGSNFNWYKLSDMTYNCTVLTAVKILEDSSNPDEVLVDGQPNCSIGPSGRCPNIEQYDIPQQCSLLGSGAFDNCSKLGYLKFVNLQKISIDWADYAAGVGTWDFSENKYIPTITSQTSYNNLVKYMQNASQKQILVPSNTVQQWKTAAYWSNLSSYIIGVSGLATYTAAQECDWKEAA